MSQGRVKRRLAAILAADVVGYSTLMGRDETGTRARLNAALDEVIRPAIASHDGRLFKTMGDGLLAEFASVVDAVDCAAMIQAQMERRATAEPAPLRLRIGVNLGDVILEGDDVHGDGVNVAARLEALAEPGGVCISRAARDQIRDKLAYRIHDLGVVEVKNIARPIRAFGLRPGRAEAAEAAPERPAAPPAARPRATEPAAVAVLPFEVRAPVPAPEDALLAQGVAEDLARSLARLAGLAIVAPSDAAEAAQDGAGPKAVGETLGVGNLLRASLRRSGLRTRLEAELVDVATGRLLWSERFDRTSEDPFDLQDELVQALAKDLAADLPNLAARNRFTHDLDAHLAWVEADRAAWRSNRASLEHASALAREALERDPGFARARSIGAFVDMQFGRFFMPRGADETAAVLRRARDAAALAVADEPEDWYVHSALGNMLHSLDDFDGSIAAFDRALELDPTNERAATRSALPLIFSGRAREAEARLRLAMRLNPFHDWFANQLLGQTLFLQGREAEAAEQLAIAGDANQDFAGGQLWRAAVFGRLGRIEEARTEARALLARTPEMTATTSFVRLSDPEAQARLEDGLRRAGLPD